MENIIVLKSSRMEDKPLWGSLFFVVSWILNIDVFVNDFHLLAKLILFVFASATTVMAAFNQWKVLQRNYKAYWVIVKIEHVFTRIGLKKIRHRRNLYKRKGEERDE